MKTPLNERIAVDIRSIQRMPYTGVEQYLISLLNEWAKGGDNYIFNLYANQSTPLDRSELIDRFNVSQSYIPNKILNTSLALFNFPDFSSYIKEKVIF